MQILEGCGEEGRRQCLATTDGSSSPLCQIFYIFMRPQHMTKASLYTGQIWNFLYSRYFTFSHGPPTQRKPPRKYIFVNTFHNWYDKMYKCISWTQKKTLLSHENTISLGSFFLVLFTIFYLQFLSQLWHLFSQFLKSFAHLGLRKCVAAKDPVVHECISAVSRFLSSFCRTVKPMVPDTPPTSQPLLREKKERKRNTNEKWEKYAWIFGRNTLGFCWTVKPMVSSYITATSQKYKWKIGEIRLSGWQKYKWRMEEIRSSGWKKYTW